MANPSRSRPFVIEAEYTPGSGKYYSVDAYRTRDEAEAMLPVFQKRAPSLQVRLRDITAKVA